jgi:hypothetical protein
MHVSIRVTVIYKENVQFIYTSNKADITETDSQH